MRILTFLICLRLGSALALGAEPAAALQKTAETPAKSGDKPSAQTEPFRVNGEASDLKSLFRVPSNPTELFLYSTRHTNEIKLTPGIDDKNITKLAATILEHEHYLQWKINNEVASKFLDQYLNTLDPLHMYFLQSDLAEFEPYRTTLDELTVKLGDTTPAHTIFSRFLERFDQQVAYVAGSLRDSKFDFSGHDIYGVSRKDLPRPQDLAEARKLWRERLRYEYLQEKLNLVRPDAIGKIVREKFNPEKPKQMLASLKDKLSKERAAELAKLIEEKAVAGKVDEVVEAAVAKVRDDNSAEILKVLTRRYARMSRMLHEYDSEDVFQMYLTALTHVYDPHSDYMDRRSFENFAIGMKNSLFGIGALLRSEDGYCKIVSLTPGGPAERSKKLKPNDRIIAVAQGDSEPVDVVDMKLNKVVDMIRGPKDTVVRLTIIPPDAADPSMRKTMTLVRDEIKLEAQDAKAKVIDVPGTKPFRLGILDLPAFYAEIVTDDHQAQNKDPKSTTTDVRRLLEKLKKEKVDGIILDLRRNGGGSLEEAINLTGLFIKEGPIVQVKRPGPDGAIIVDRDEDKSVLYDGPLIVLTSRFSASASEILAGALQDYGRALIVGDSSTHGKGTVQSLIRLKPIMDRYQSSPSNDPGALKITIRKFYRANGASTQLKGVLPDIVLPSLNNHAEVGESSLDNPLPWDTIPSAKFEKLNRIEPFLAELRKRSEARVASDKDFIYLRDEIARFQKAVAEKSVSMNEEQRWKEKLEAEARVEARKKELRLRPEAKEKVYEVTLKNADLPGLQPLLKTNEVAVAETPKLTPEDSDGTDTEAAAADEKLPAVDITLEETKRILADLIKVSAKDSSVAARN
jgi:carboxyl-terminal processing protease